MSSRLQLDVRNLSLWRRHLVNTYEVWQALWSMPWASRVWGTTIKAIYKSHYLAVSDWHVPPWLSVRWALNRIWFKYNRWERPTLCSRCSTHGAMRINFRFRFWSRWHFRVIVLHICAKFLQISSSSTETLAFYEIQYSSRPPSWICCGM